MLALLEYQCYVHCPEKILREDSYVEECRPGDGWIQFLSEDIKEHMDSRFKDGYAFTMSLQHYIGRSLTKQEDILHAFSGVTNLYQTVLGEIWWGIPVKYFVPILAWQPWYHLRHATFRGRRSGFPSWSWAGWEFMNGEEIKFYFFESKTLLEMIQIFRLNSFGELEPLPTTGMQSHQPLYADLLASGRQAMESALS
jgi:hypothetical protein